jgi:hypothetical protein
MVQIPLSVKYFFTLSKTSFKKNNIFLRICSLITVKAGTFSTLHRSRNKSFQKTQQLIPGIGQASSE